mmetsp:Transcript_26649/g.42247  ORF Transcript_26649/g.42247 Transcript_26649/m.42247 type:complete len:320 (-) Transcript_26649:190-1149(-)
MFRCLCPKLYSAAMPSRVFLQRVGETMVKTSALNRTGAEVLGALIRNNDTKLFSSATRLRGRKPEDKDVQVEIREKVMNHLEAAWEDAFKNMPTSKARRIASRGRDHYDTTQGDLIYGEVTFSSLSKILTEDLKKHNIALNGTFYDLGSGTGRGVIAAALVGSFDRLCGIEMLEVLHQAALDVQREYETRVVPRLSLSNRNQELKFVKGNLLKANWSDASVIFINSTCFSNKLMENIAKQAVSLKTGACVVTLTRPMVSPYFRLLDSKKYSMSWGDATAHIHIRTEKPDPEAEANARYWNSKKPGRKDFGALFDGYTSA